MVIALALAISQSVDAVSSCDRVGNGFACKDDDFQSYIECSRGKQISVKLCPTNQMCSCGLNRICRDPSTVICVKRPSFPKSAIPMDFTVYFNGIHTSANPVSNVRLTSSGNIWQDTTPGDEKFKMKQTFKKWNSQTVTKDVITVIRKDGSKYVQYTLVKDYTTKVPTERCSKQVLSKFEDFFYDLRTHSQQVPKQDPTDDDVFVYRDGPLDAGSGFTLKSWTMGSRHITQQYVPWRYNVRKSSGPLGKSSQQSQLTLGYFYLSKPSDAFFMVPHQCFQIKQTVA
eukprot:TCONS_00005040-protein